MKPPAQVIQEAFQRLRSSRSLSERPEQIQLSMLIGDLIESGQNGIFEAPTGLGKSLAALVPAIAHAACSQKRTVIATYTNLLAEQYWTREAPLALSLFDDELQNSVEIEMLMGRQRYCCVAELGTIDSGLRRKMMREADRGDEGQFRQLFAGPAGAAAALWSKVHVPVVCPARLCGDYQDCFYYSARRKAAKAGVIITNHSVVIQDALMKQEDTGGGLLGAYDFLIVDEAHDFHLAAANGLEFELSSPKLQTFSNIGLRLGTALLPIAHACEMTEEWRDAVETFEHQTDQCRLLLQRMAAGLAKPGIVASSPETLSQNRLIQLNRSDITPDQVSDLGASLAQCSDEFRIAADRLLSTGAQMGVPAVEAARESTRNYRSYLDGMARSINAMLTPEGISVTHASRWGTGMKIRLDTIGLGEPLSRLLWSQTPACFLSATLAIDRNFEFFRDSIGCHADFEDILESPFDHPGSSVLYLPEAGTIPDPGQARKCGGEDAYFAAIANQVENIIRVMNGRTLVLFHSRREMEEIARRVCTDPDLPILIQPARSSAEVGEQFKSTVHSTLFALRSFWTGFDAPGETLSCVVIVRIPFEVPVEPTQIARAAHLQEQGINPFAAYTLPLAKMLVRQASGRLLRNTGDRGVIALLDPRLRTKPYGEEFIENLPRGLSVFSDFECAVAASGVQPIAKRPAAPNLRTQA